jgi:DNA repair photolyase
MPRAGAAHPAALPPAPQPALTCYAGPPKMAGPPPNRGRGAGSNPANRFLPTYTVPDLASADWDDGWSPGETDAGARPRKTTVTPEASRTIITRNQSPDVPFEASINPYKGCEHGCIYCFARPSHAYLDLSPGLDFETRIFSKPEAARLLRAALRKPGYRVQTIALGANTDPYQQAERELGITRQLLEVFVEFRHPVSIVTKSNLVLRDLDLLRALAADNLLSVFVSVTTLDRELARRMEPRAPTPTRRLEAIGGLRAVGVPVGVLASPMIPGLNDSELEAILAAAAAAGASTAGYILLRLPLELKELFEGWLQDHYPLKKQRILQLVRETRGGQLYQQAFGTRMRGTGPYAELLQRRFAVATRRLGLHRRHAPLDCNHFRVPPTQGDQLTLF